MSASAKVTIPAFFGPQQVPKWFATWAEGANAPELVVELSPESFLEPAGVSVLAAGIAARGANGLRTHVHADPNSDVVGYLQRIDFHAVLGLETRDPGHRRDPSGRFVPLRRVTDLKVARTIADEIAVCLEQQLPGLAPSLQRAAHFILEELGANIVQHSGRADTGFGVAQAFATQRRLQISFADAGAGFLRSLQKNLELATRLEDEGEALQIALEKGVTGGDPRANLGFGLAFLRAVADQLNAELWIASGGALLHRRTVGGVRVSNTRAISAWQGAWVCMDAPLPTPRA